MSQKVCQGCQLSKPLKSFGRGNRICATCKSRARRAKHPEKIKEISRDYRRVHRQRYPGRLDRSRLIKRRERKLEILAAIGQHQCLDCGNDDVRVLQFHHRDPAEKEFEVCNAISHHWEFARILVEARECDVVCANCHIIRHHKAIGD
jgi:hypothetical protein